MRARRAIGWVVVAACAVLIPVGSASAQISLGGLNLEGEVEAGLRLLPGKPSEAVKQKFEEYRDFTEGAFLSDLRVRIFTPDERY